MGLYRYLLANIALLPIVSGSAFAATAEQWQLGLPKPASPLANVLYSFHNDILLPLIIIITLFVLFLLIYVCWRFSAKRNPTPSTTTHHTWLEVLWTGVPVIILALLFIPSMKALYLSDTDKAPDMTLKVTGNQWYWHYNYPDYDNFGFDAYMVAEADLPEGQQHLFKMLTDNIVVLPTNKRVRLQFTSNDVLHNWSISDLAVRIDTVPGRLNEAWTLIEKEGTYYGFCSELCGDGHAYMPITVKAVSDNDFALWVKWAKGEFGDAGAVDLTAGEQTRLAKILKIDN
jgi:cytochrome c oxidase subunit 2